jgi:hypothetical protein
MFGHRILLQAPVLDDRRFILAAIAAVAGVHGGTQGDSASHARLELKVSAFIRRSDIRSR